MKTDGDALKVFNLLETKGYKSRNEDRNRALALTLVDFFLRRSKNGFHNLIKALKSQDALAPGSSNFGTNTSKPSNRAATETPTIIM